MRGPRNRVPLAILQDPPSIEGLTHVTAMLRDSLKGFFAGYRWFRGISGSQSAINGRMALQLFSIATQLEGPAGFVRQASPALQPSPRAKAVSGSELSDVLFEQLGYLIQYADKERARLERVKAVLLETFN